MFLLRRRKIIRIFLVLQFLAIWTANTRLIGGLFQFSLMIYLVIASRIGMVVNSRFPDSDNAYQYSVWWMVPLGMFVSCAMCFSNKTPRFHLLNSEDDEAEAVSFHPRVGADEKATRREFNPS